MVLYFDYQHLTEFEVEKVRKKYPQQGVNIMVAPERHKQIKAIAKALGLSIADAIGRMVNAEIARGTIPADIPGFTIMKVADSVGFTIRDGDMPNLMTREAAKALAATIADFAVGAETAGAVYNVDHQFVVANRGTGIAISVPTTDGSMKVVSRDVARDVARLLEQAAA